MDGRVDSWMSLMDDGLGGWGGWIEKFGPAGGVRFFVWINEG